MTEFQKNWHEDIKLDEIKETVNGLKKEVQEVKDESKKLREENEQLKRYIFDQVCKPSNDDNREIQNLSIYIDTENSVEIFEVYSAVVDFLKAIDFVKTIELKPIKGSWFKRLIATSTSAITSKEVTDRLKEAEYGVGEFVSITAMSFSNYQKNGLKWDRTELKLIYKQLKDSLKKVVKLDNKFKERPISFAAILEEMVEFLKMFQPQLASISDFQRTQSLAINERNLARKYQNIEEGLSSQDPLVVKNSMGELDGMVYMNSFRTEYITLTLNRILFQAEPCVETSLGYIAIWLYYKDRGEKFHDQQSLLVQILKKYESDPLKEADKAFVEEKLIRIAWKLNAWQNQDAIVGVWLKKAARSRFNNVRQFLVDVKNRDGDLHDD